MCSSQYEQYAVCSSSKRKKKGFLPKSVLRLVLELCSFHRSRRFAVRAEAPVTRPLCVNPLPSIIDELFMDISPLPLLPPGTRNVDSVRQPPQTPRRNSDGVGPHGWGGFTSLGGYTHPLSARAVSISSKKAISRAFSLHISSDQIDRKWYPHVVYVCVCARRPSVIMGATHDATKAALYSAQLRQC